MNEIANRTPESPFDAIRRVDADGRESWSARELMAHFGYARWPDVRDGISRARTAIAKTLGEDAAQANIEPDLKTVRVGYGDRDVEDFRLTRYGAYMWAMNGDPRKSEIAAAQTYFAVKTREAELEPAQDGDDLDLLYGILDRIREDRRRIVSVEGRQDTAEARLDAIEGVHGWFTALGYAIKYGHQRDRGYLSKVGAKSTRLLKERGEMPVKRDDATFGEINTYPADVLATAFAEVEP